MKNLNLYATKAESMLTAMNIEYHSDINYVVNNKSRSVWGRCSYKSGNTIYLNEKRAWENRQYTISISDRLLEDSTPDQALLETLIHELLHSTFDGMSHTGTWKILAERVNKRYGYNIKRCDSTADKGLDPMLVKSKYMIKCTCCGSTWHRNRMSEIIKYPDNYRCNCGGKLEVFKM